MNRICIDESYCKGCHLCIHQCPQGVFEVSSNRNPKGYLVPKVSKREGCKACLLCEMICPDMVISVEKIEDEK